MATTSPTPEAFEKLLSRLHPDREQAGEEYELLRLKLQEYFHSRACFYAEELTDETMNRLAKKIAEGEEVRDVLRFCHGLAHWVWVEHLKRPDARRVTFDDLPVEPFVLPDSILQKQRDACFYYCLKQLPAADGALIIEYWEHVEQTNREARQKMSLRLGITLIALRIRISRIKTKLETCFYNCLEKGRSKTK